MNSATTNSTRRQQQQQLPVDAALGEPVPQAGGRRTPPCGHASPAGAVRRGGPRRPRRREHQHARAGVDGEAGPGRPGARPCSAARRCSRDAAVGTGLDRQLAALVLHDLDASPSMPSRPAVRRPRSPRAAPPATTSSPACDLAGRGRRAADSPPPVDDDLRPATGTTVIGSRLRKPMKSGDVPVRRVACTAPRACRPAAPARRAARPGGRPATAPPPGRA